MDFLEDEVNQALSNDVDVPTNGKKKKGKKEAGDVASNRAAENAANEEETLHLKQIVSQLTPDEYKRYLEYSSTTVDRTHIRKLINDICPNEKVPQHYVIVMGAITKEYVGALVELSRCMMLENGRTGPIPPQILHDAYRHLHAKGDLVTIQKPPLFKRRR